MATGTAAGTIDFTASAGGETTGGRVFIYICTKSTADPYLPSRFANLDMLARDVSDAFLALSGGRLQVGELAMFPVQRSVANHLLCDGREVSKASFAELYAYLGDTQGLAAAATDFRLPDYRSKFEPAPITAPETVTSGTVSTEPPAETSPTYYPEQSDPLYGDVDSGGRYNDATVIP